MTKKFPSRPRSSSPPEPVKEGNTFLFWCKDAECNDVFDPEIESVSEITALYAAWANNTVTFDFGNGTTVSETFSYNTEIIYPNNLPEKEGYMFIGWFINKVNETEVTSETIINITTSITLYAHWEEVTNQVVIVFNKKDLTKEEAEKIVKQYTNAEFEITNYENDSGEVRIIVKFLDEESAENFVKIIKGSDEAASIIKKINFIANDPNSFSGMVHPLSFFNALFL